MTPGSYVMAMGLQKSDDDSQGRDKRAASPPALARPAGAWPHASAAWTGSADDGPRIAGSMSAASCAPRLTPTDHRRLCRRAV
jgi:hypothetical protein